MKGAVFRQCLPLKYKQWWQFHPVRAASKDDRKMRFFVPCSQQHQLVAFLCNSSSHQNVKSQWNFVYVDNVIFLSSHYRPLVSSRTPLSSPTLLQCSGSFWQRVVHALIVKHLRLINLKHQGGPLAKPTTTISLAHMSAFRRNCTVDKPLPSARCSNTHARRQASSSGHLAFSFLGLICSISQST